MGFKVEINQVIRVDELPKDFKEGGIFTVEKDGSRVFADSFPIWLTMKDWTPIAEIQVVSQVKEENKITVTYKVQYIYKDEVQETIKKMFVRMYGWE